MAQAQRTHILRRNGRGYPSQGTIRVRRTIPENEGPREKFKRIGTLRLDNALRAMSLLPHLANETYDGRPHEYEQIAKKLIDKAAEVATALGTRPASGPDRWSLIKFEDE